MWKGPYRKSCGCIEAVVDRLFIGELHVFRGHADW